MELYDIQQQIDEIKEHHNTVFRLLNVHEYCILLLLLMCFGIQVVHLFTR